MPFPSTKSIAPCDTFMMASVQSGHRFSIETFLKPTFCVQCDKMIMGVVRQGYKCSNCDCAFHKDCIQNATTGCSKQKFPTTTNSPEITTGMPHQLKLSNYMVPTKCAICHDLLKGVFKQGLQCIYCQYNVHEKCQKAVATNCLRSPVVPDNQGGQALGTELQIRRDKECGILMRGYLDHFTDQDSHETRHFWCLSPTVISLYDKEPSKEAAASMVISLKHIEKIQNNGSQEVGNKYHFAISTRELNLYVVVPDLDKMMVQLGLPLVSSWETAIRQALSAIFIAKEVKRMSSVKGMSSAITSELGDRFDILHDKKIGNGQFGAVYKAFDKKTQTEVAVKLIDKRRFSPDSLKNEVLILQQLDHPGIISMLSVQESPEMVYVFMEMMDGGDLFDYIVQRPQQKLCEREARVFTAQILAAIRYLHNRDVAHCDLKPENILLTKIDHLTRDVPDEYQPQQIKLCDFGYSRIIGEASFRKSIVGTPAYLAPEVMMNQAYNRSLDLWSVGVIIYVALTGYFPFKDIAELKDRMHSFSKMFPVDLWQECTYPAVHLTGLLLQVKPSDRPTAKDCLQHEWLTGEECRQDLQKLQQRTGKTWLTGI